jgi:hypothetical protein
MYQSLVSQTRLQGSFTLPSHEPIFKSFGCAESNTSALLRPEVNRLVRAVNWHEAKQSIVRGAIRTFVAFPGIKLTPNMQLPRSWVTSAYYLHRVLILNSIKSLRKP